ncbi:MAG: hypothetical protein H7228_04275 [Polaromonas sp.]|nr:hypothetical protein [Polaromonas sp.]
MMRSETELRQLLPWYVNGTLDAANQRDVESLIIRSPLVASEATWLKHLREQIQNLPDEAVQRSPGAGLDTLLALIRAEQSGKVMRLPLRNRLNIWLESPRKFSLPVGLAAAVVLTQAAMIGALLNHPPAEQLSPLSVGASAANTLLQITFKPQATEIQIRSLLASVQGDMVAGPGALGVYVLRVPDGQGAAALAKLRNDRVAIESVVLLPSRSPAALR